MSGEVLRDSACQCPPMPDIDTKELLRLMDASEALFQEWLDRAEDDDHPARAAILDRFNSAHLELLSALFPALPALLSEAEEAARLREELAAFHAAPAAEPVGEVILFGGISGLKEVSWRKGRMPAVGTKLYAAPPAPVADGQKGRGIEAARDAYRSFCASGHPVDIVAAIIAAYESAAPAAQPVAWMNHEHIAAYKARTIDSTAWASPVQTEFYGVPLYTAPPAPVADWSDAASQIIGEIEQRFPNWRSYRDLIDCIDCTLHDLRSRAAEAGR